MVVKKRSGIYSKTTSLRNLFNVDIKNGLVKTKPLFLKNLPLVVEAELTLFVRLARTCEGLTKKLIQSIGITT